MLFIHKMAIYFFQNGKKLSVFGDLLVSKFRNFIQKISILS
jgi:hypothetical protein